METIDHKCTDPSCEGTKAEFVDTFLVKSKGKCRLVECLTCGIMYILDEEGNFVEEE